MPGIHILTTRSQSGSEHIDDLRELKHLAVVDADLDEEQDYKQPIAVDWEKARKIWKGKLISLLKDSPSMDRKVLRWKVTQSYYDGEFLRRRYSIVENEELEISPETPLLR